MPLLDRDEAHAYVSPDPDAVDDGRPTWHIGTTDVRADPTSHLPSVDLIDPPEWLTPTGARRLAVALLYAAEETDAAERRRGARFTV